METKMNITWVKIPTVRRVGIYKRGRGVEVGCLLRNNSSLVIRAGREPATYGFKSCALPIGHASSNPWSGA